MPGLRKAQLYNSYKEHRTSALSASPACSKFCHFATVSALEETRSDWSSWIPTPGAGLAANRAGESQKLSCLVEGSSLGGLRLHWSLLLAGLTRCMSSIRHAAEGIAPQTSPALEISGNKTHFLSGTAGKGARGWHISLYCISGPCSF